MVLIVGNHAIQFEDETDAIVRRIRILRTQNKSLSRIPLIQYDKRNEKWLGEIASELGSIFHWAMTMDDADKYINDTVNNVPSLREDYEELLENIDPLSSFITQQLKTGKGTYIQLPILSFRKFGNLLVEKLR